MKTIETTFEPNKDGNVAIGVVTLTGTDKEVQDILNKIGELKDTSVSTNYILNEYVRVQDERCYEFCEILGVGAAALEVADKNGKTIVVPMSSVQNMGERRVLSLIGGRVPKDIEVGDLVLLDRALYQCNKTITTYPFTLLSGNGETYPIITARFAPNDSVITPDGLKGTVLGYEENGEVNVGWDDINSTFHDESELEPWNSVTAVQRYAASFGMKVNVDVS
jgi:hypothetical protein